VAGRLFQWMSWCVFGESVYVIQLPTMSYGDEALTPLSQAG